MGTQWSILQDFTDNYLHDGGAIGSPNYGIDIGSVAGWESHPGMSGGNWRIPGVDGTIHRSNKPYPEQQFQLPLLILPYDRTTGEQTLDPWRHIRDNIDWLDGLIEDSELINVRKRSTISGGGFDPWRSALCEIVDAYRIGPYRGTIARAFLATFNMPTPGWRLIPEVTNANPVGTFNPGGTMRTRPNVIRFVGGTNPTLTNTLNGEEIGLVGTVSGITTITLDGKYITVTGGGLTKANLTRNSRRFMVFEPRDQTMNYSGGGTVNVDYHTRYKS